VSADYGSIGMVSVHVAPKARPCACYAVNIDWHVARFGFVAPESPGRPTDVAFLGVGMRRCEHVFSRSLAGVSVGLLSRCSGGLAFLSDGCSSCLRHDLAAL
jgi:hypothetical protein